MSPLFQSSRSLRRAIGAALLLAGSLAPSHGSAASAPRPAGAAVLAPDGRDLAADLAQARTDAEAAEAALDAAKRIAAPGHLLDPLPARLMAGLGEVQAEYAEMQRKVAGYRATLGDQHPTLKGADEVLAGLRGQILDGAKRAGAAAQQDVTRARATIASLERQMRAADATGAITKPAPSLPPARDAAEEPTRLAPEVSAPADPVIPHHATAPPEAASDGSIGATLLHRLARGVPLALRYPAAAAAAGLTAGSAALLLLVALVRPRRRRAPLSPVIRIEPAAPVEAARPAPVSAQDRGSEVRDQIPAPPPRARPGPVLAVLPLADGDDPAGVLARLDRETGADLARGAASVMATLAAAGGAQGRLSVLVTSVAGAPETHAQCAALALASAAAAAGRRVLLVDGSAAGEFGRALAPATAEPAATVAMGGRLRDVLRVTVAGRVLAMLRGEAGDGRDRQQVPRLPDLDGFETIVMAGRPDGGEIVAAGFALLVAPEGADAAAVTAALALASGDHGRPCGLLLTERRDAAVTEVADAPRPPGSFPSRRRAAPEAAAARLGLRRTFDPVRRPATRTG